MQLCNIVGSMNELTNYLCLTNSDTQVQTRGEKIKYQMTPNFKMHIHPVPVTVVTPTHLFELCNSITPTLLSM